MFVNQAIRVTIFLIVLQKSESCPEGELADKFLLHFQPDNPRGIPGFDIEDAIILPEMSFGPVTMLHMELHGLSQMITHNFSVNLHTFNGSLSVSFPMLEFHGVYQLPGLWWTTEGNFTVRLSDLTARTALKIAILDDSCPYIEDFTSNITKSNFTFTTDDSEDSGVLGLFFNDFVEVLVNITKPTILERVNLLVRQGLTSFLPVENVTVTSYADYPIVPFNASAYDVPPIIPPFNKQKKALINLVKYQVPWMFGKPVSIPGVTLNIMAIAEIHDMSVHNLEQVTDIQHLSLDYDGEEFIMKTRMLHDNVINRHRVLWFPRAIFRTWQWTEAKLGLVKHKALLKLNRRMNSPPSLAEFMVRPVLFNPDSQTAIVRGLSRMSRRLMDAMRTSFGDAITALLYSPLRNKANHILTAVNPRQLVKNFVCYGTGPRALLEAN